MQLEAAEVTIHETEKDAVEHSEKLLFRARSFQRDQAGIDRRVEAITASEEMKDLARRIQASMGRLQQLEVAKRYIQLIQIVHSLRYALILASLNWEAYFLMHVAVRKQEYKSTQTPRQLSCHTQGSKIS